MKKPTKKRPSKGGKDRSAGRGPLARKVIAATRQLLEARVTNLSEWREASLSAEEGQATVVSREELAGHDPAHALYVYAQNQLSVLIEIVSGVPALRKLAQAYGQAEDEYMPSGPPWSPLTGSYFFCWGAFDLCTIGAKRESLGSIAIDVSTFLRVDEGLIALYRKMQASRMGVFRHEGMSGDHVILRELVTSRRIEAVTASGYPGRSGEIWLARVFPPPLDHGSRHYSVVFTTPYVLGKRGISGEIDPSVEQEWLAYFQRTLPKTRIENKERAYEALMKYGLSRNYWNEYVFLAYRGHENNMIVLEGVPDIPSTLPHSGLSRERGQ